jgi:predicted O-methyltransferase YrrM
MVKKKTKKQQSQIGPIKQFLNNLNELDLQDGNLTDIDAFALIQLAKSVADKTTFPIKFLEVGCWKGKSTACLALVASKYPSGKVYSIDNFKGAPKTKEEKTAQTSNIISIFKQNMEMINAQDITCLLNMDVRDATIILNQHTFDLVFIDGSNYYYDVQETIDYAFNWVREGGIICGRNLAPTPYNELPEEVKQQAFDTEYLPELKIHPGITKAVNEAFAGKHNTIVKSSLWYWTKHVGG